MRLQQLAKRMGTPTLVKLATFFGIASNPYEDKSGTKIAESVKLPDFPSLWVLKDRGS